MNVTIVADDADLDTSTTVAASPSALEGKMMIVAATPFGFWKQLFEGNDTFIGKFG